MTLWLFEVLVTKGRKGLVKNTHTFCNNPNFLLPAESLIKWLSDILLFKDGCIFNYVFSCVYECNTHRDQKRVLGPLELGLQAAASLPRWARGTERGSLYALYALYAFLHTDPSLRKLFLDIPVKWRQSAFFSRSEKHGTFTLFSITYGLHPCRCEHTCLETKGNSQII